MVEYLGFARFQSHQPDLKRWIPTVLLSHKALFTALCFIGFASVVIWQRSIGDGLGLFFGAPLSPCSSGHPVVFNLTDFGGLGDGVTLNTKAFESAIKAIAKNRGGQLNVQAGVWLTAPFNLTSHMTLFLEEGAIIRGIEDEKYWTLMPPLASYGSGREHPGPRYGSLIHGQHLKDVTITGHNGTIDGQGKSWWIKYRQKLLNHTRGPLVQIMWSSNIRISNVTLMNPPFWTLHPFDCKNVTITNVTILAPLFDAPNTDGIDPDSCENVVIEDCYISVGDDAIAIKSGWDQFGIRYGRPSSNILIRNLVVQSMVSAGISIGSEMSGGVSNVRVENIHVWNSKRAVRIKTSVGRGGYVRNISYRNLTFDNCRVGIIIKTDYNEHPDDNYDRKAFPILEDFTFDGVHGQNVRVPVRLHGSEDIPVKNISFRDISIGISYKKKHIFQCSYVEGRVIGTIFPAPCDNLDQYDEQGQLVKAAVSPNITDIDYSF